MKIKQIKEKLEEKGYFVEEQPKYKITHDVDEGFLIETDDLEEFYGSVLKETPDKRGKAK